MALAVIAECVDFERRLSLPSHGKQPHMSFSRRNSSVLVRAALVSIPTAQQPHRGKRTTERQRRPPPPEHCSLAPDTDRACGNDR